MVGDGEVVFLYDQNPDGSVSPVRCFRAADGVEVTVPDSSAAFTNIKRTTFYGRKVLVFDDETGKKALRLYDLLTGKDIWKKALGVEGWQLRSEDDTFTGYVTSNGDIVVLNAADGKEVFKNRLDEAKKGKHLEKVNDAMLLSDGERFFVLLNRPHEGANRGYNPIFTQAIRSVKVNGTMYAFDRASGKRLWFTDEQFEDQHLVLEQFADLPIIMAASQYQKFAANGNFEGNFTKFVAIDKTSGKLKYYKQGVSQGSQYYSIVTDPKAGTIDVLNYSGQRVRFMPDDGKTVGRADETSPKGPLTPDGPAVPGRVGIAIQLRPAVVVPAVTVPAKPAKPVKPARRRIELVTSVSEPPPPRGGGFRLGRSRKLPACVLPSWQARWPQDYDRTQHGAAACGYVPLTPQLTRTFASPHWSPYE